MREGARAHEIDDTAASKIDSAATKTKWIVQKPITQSTNQPTHGILIGGE